VLALNLEAAQPELVQLDPLHCSNAHAPKKEVSRFCDLLLGEKKKQSKKNEKLLFFSPKNK
jgi:hypothetical protein